MWGKGKLMRTLIAFMIALAAATQLFGAERTDKIFLQGVPSGSQTVRTEADGSARAEYSYSDSRKRSAFHRVPRFPNEPMCEGQGFELLELR